MAADGVEREFKLMLADGAERDRLLDALPAERPTVLHQNNTLIDTADWRLAHAGLSLRLRNENGTWLLTAKGPESPEDGGTLSARPEAERVLAPWLAEHVAHGAFDPVPLVRGAMPMATALRLADLIEAAADGRAVTPRGAFANERTLVPVSLPGGTACSLALDRTSMPDGSEHHEVELEVAAESVPAAAAWLDGLMLGAGVPQRPSSGKSQRFQQALKRASSH